MGSSTETRVADAQASPCRPGPAQNVLRNRCPCGQFVPLELLPLLCRPPGQPGAGGAPFSRELIITSMGFSGRDTAWQGS